MTPYQGHPALAKGQERRLARARLLNEIRDKPSRAEGCAALCSLLLDNPPEIQSASIELLLMTPPRIYGRVVGAFLAEQHMIATKQWQDLTERQRGAVHIFLREQARVTTRPKRHSFGP